MEKQWRLLSPDTRVTGRLTRALKVRPVTAAILANRGFTTPEEAQAFVKPSLAALTPPWHLKDMDRAVERIYRALQQQERILIFGDYDVDGVTAATLLFDFLQAIGGEVSLYIPHRIREGYSIRPQHIREQAQPGGIRLIITVDCGSGSHEAVQAAGAAGIDVIISDHHETGAALPQAAAVVNPKRRDCPAGLATLAGVGVSFFLVIALRRFLRQKGFWQETPEPNLKSYCDLVALGTIADLVPLVNDNRILVQTGLDQINSQPRDGIRAMVEGTRGQSPPLNEMDIAFTICPQLNAAGRVRHADRAVALLAARDGKAAATAAETLARLNRERKETETEIFDEIVHYLRRYPAGHHHEMLVLSSPAWHEGVLGIVASRLVERLHCPVVLIATRNGVGKGSGRSIPGIHLHQCLSQCADTLIDFGGHEMAAGVRIDADRITDFSDAFRRSVVENGRHRSQLPILDIDAVIDFSMINPEMLSEIEALRPFGPGNREPLFQADGVFVQHSMVVGGRHRKMQLAQQQEKDARRLPAIQFNVDRDLADQRYFKKIAFHLRWNHWKGRRSIQLTIQETG